MSATADTSAPRTTALLFSSINHCQKLFQVSGDVPAREALEAASLYLASALDMSSDAVQEDQGDGAYAVSYLIEMAKAVVDSVTAGLIRGEVQSSASACLLSHETEEQRELLAKIERASMNAFEWMHNLNRLRAEYQKISEGVEA